jgi:hypothetical protein
MSLERMVDLLSGILDVVAASRKLEMAMVMREGHQGIPTE